MRIGIDAKWYFNGHPSGKVVVENIVNHIVKLDKTITFYIFLSNADKNIIFPISQENICLVYIPNPMNALTNVFIMPFYTKKYKLDVCMYQNYCPLFGAKKIVNYVHDALFMDYKSYFSIWEHIYFRPMKYLSKFADHIITISNSEKERLIKHKFGKRENIDVVHHGLGLANEKIEYFNPDFLVKYNLPENYILYLGRLNIRKNIQNLLRAIPNVNKKVSLVIVGKEDHKTFDWNKIVKELKIKDRVFKLGYVESKDIGRIYKEASIFCFPSFAEGFGLPPLEAMHYNIPVVVSDKTSLPEVCGEAALYVDPNNPDDIAKKINYLIDNPKIRTELIEKGKEKVKQYSWVKASKEILSILKSI